MANFIVVLLLAVLLFSNVADASRAFRQKKRRSRAYADALIAHNESVNKKNELKNQCRYTKSIFPKDECVNTSDYKNIYDVPGVTGPNQLVALHKNNCVPPEPVVVELTYFNSALLITVILFLSKYTF